MPETNQIATTIEDIHKLLDALPALATERKNIYKLAGVSRQEEVNSNLLAFYFDKQEEHGFGTLFFDSLIELAGLDKTLADYDYEIFREFKNIDILIASRSKDSESKIVEEFEWAVIIENKIFHVLNNDLTGYWNHVKVKKEGSKFGIVLSPYGQGANLLNLKSPANTSFIDIRHKGLTDKVKEMLPPYFMGSDDRHLLLLKEYISNVESMYMNENEIKAKDDRLKIYQEHFDKIKKILALQHEMRDHVIDEVIRVMRSFGFEPSNTSTKVQGKHFFREEGGAHPDFFRVYFWFPSLTDEGKLNVSLELHKEFTRYGADLHKNAKFRTLLDAFPHLESGSGSGAGFFHVVKYKNFPLDVQSSQGSFFDELKNRLFNDIFDPEKGFLKECTYLLKEIMSPEDYERGLQARV